MMKSLQVILFLTLGSATSIYGNIGTLTCDKSQGIAMDKNMETTIGVKCPVNPQDLPPFDATKPMTEADFVKLLGPSLGAQVKCKYSLIKAVDAKGKIIPKQAEHMVATFKPKDFHDKMKTKLSACVTKHNPELKKETGKAGKSWIGFAMCFHNAIGEACHP